MCNMIYRYIRRGNSGVSMISQRGRPKGGTLTRSNAPETYGNISNLSQEGKAQCTPNTPLRGISTGAGDMYDKLEP